MEKNDLDREMKAIMDRLTNKPAVSSDPYSSDPLSSDHFLLTKSWDFFRRRIAMIEKQCQDILNAKNDELRLTRKEVELLKNQIHEVEEANAMLDGQLSNFKLSRLQDFDDFKKKSEMLRLSWNEERVTLEATLMKLESQIEREKKRNQSEREAAQATIMRLNETIQSLRKDSQDTAAKALESQAETQKIVVEKDETLDSYEAKISLLRHELDRRDQIIQSHEAKMQEQVAQEKKLDQVVSDLRRQVEIRDEDIARLKQQLEILKNEKSTLQDSWNSEKAEWRELWDRAREVWKKEK